MFLTFASSLVFLASSSVAPIAPWDDLLRDLALWNAEATIADVDLQAESQEDVYFNETDLFPKNESSTVSSVAIASSRSALSSVVSVRVDGEMVLLRDVPVDAWFAPYVISISDKSWISGYRDTAGNPTGFFGPGDSVTVGQVAKVLVQAAGIDVGTCAKQPHNRSAHNDWSAPFVSCAEQAGWTLFEDASIETGRPATRAEVVGTLLQALSIQPASSFVSPFTDVRATTAYADAIAQAQKDRIINGYKDAQGNLLHRFGPFDPVTRAEFAKIVVGGLDTYEK